MSRQYWAYLSGFAFHSCFCSSESRNSALKLSTRLAYLHVKLVPPGPAYFAPKPVVIQTGDLKKGYNFLTAEANISSRMSRSLQITYLVELKVRSVQQMNHLL